LATRGQMERHWDVAPRQVWGRWAGVDAAEPEYP
jgi:hypothetical protein